MDRDLSRVTARFEDIYRFTLSLVPNLIIALLAFTLFYFLAIILEKVSMNVLQRARQPEEAARVIGRLARWALISLGVLVAATIIFPSLDASSILGALGVGSVAIGFAFKDIFQNMLAGILILISRPFRIGDQIVSGRDEGTVEDIQIRATRLRTYDNRLVLIPNSDLFTNRVIVNTGFDRRRIHVSVGIGSNENIDGAIQIINDAVSKIDGVLPSPPPSTVVADLSDFSIKLDVRAWTNPPIRSEIVATQDAMLRAIKAALDKANIEMPYPTQVIILAPHHAVERDDGVDSNSGAYPAGMRWPRRPR